MEYKHFKMSIKGIDDQAGTIQGNASVFGNIDLVNDIVETGAFAKTILESGGKVPIINEHWCGEIGLTKSLSENDAGLGFDGQLYIDNGNPLNEVREARDVFVRVKRRNELGKPMGVSIGYSAVKKEYIEQDGRTIRVLKEVKLHEISIVSFAVNPLATVTGVKAFRGLIENIKAGDVDKETLEEAIKSLQALLSKLEPGDHSDSKGAADKGEDEPDIHSLLADIKADVDNYAGGRALLNELRQFGKEI